LLMTGAKSLYEQHKGDGTYQKLLSEDSKFTEQIDLDVNRSYRNHIQFKERFGVGQITLFNVLKAYAIRDKEVGYCQGMSDLTAFLLMYIPEEEAFWTLERVLNDKKYDLRGRFLPGFPALRKSFWIFERLIEKRFSKVYAHLKKLDLDPMMYAFRWFIMVFLEVYPFHYIVRIFDLFMWHGYDIVYSISMATIKLVSEKLLRAKALDTVMEVFKALAKFDELGEDQFVDLILEQRVEPNKIRTLERKYEKQQQQQP